MKCRHAFDGEVQDHINGAAIRNIHGIGPIGMRERHAIFCVGQKVHLVCGKDAVRWFVENSQMLIDTYAALVIGLASGAYLAIDVEAILVLREDDSEFRSVLFSGSASIGL